MRIMSFNSRGVGRRVKKRTVRELVSKEKLGMVCLQETKCDQLDFNMCTNIWGSDSFEYVARNAVNKAGGLLTIWEKGVFKLVNSFQGDGFVGVKGFWGDCDEYCHIVNVYSPCFLAEKRNLWVELINLRIA